MVRQRAPSGKSDDLTFGLILHGSLERYAHSIRPGGTGTGNHDDALLLAFQWAWAQCKRWTSNSTYKNPYTLLRTLVWYLDTYKDDPFETLTLPALGTPAVEYSFLLQTEFTTSDGECINLAGHLDRVATLGPGGPLYILDTKTTKNPLGEDYFGTYSPDNQISLYTWAGLQPELFPDIGPIAGTIIDAIQVGVTFSRFGRVGVTRSPGQLEEWYADLGVWVALAETYARAGHWPQNDKACFRCPFRGVCSKDPSIRDLFLDSPDFEDFIWDPAQSRTPPT